jgi:hypothetical protein
MLPKILTNSHFADAILRAVLAVEAGQGDTVILTQTSQGEVSQYTVWGAWDGDVFSWRMVDGAHPQRPAVTAGEQVYAGHGDDLDATVAACRVCCVCSMMGAGEWQVRS